ncbi:uncharacterized protein LOC110094577 [Dendrobium catenatum]|uniref:ZCF37 n=1 Tax=Dendrobium catenatum TaxID=906689 RepID=A0A2I0WLR8_9ASPA|nr:uncharacterized protein LOC110094577 [Dendrobium catenatum]PKU76602.1 hypothetical protein MA16_Dca001207 [Dendrobium catenatum]
MFCGTSSFHHDADDSPSSSPKAAKKKSNRNKNPYSSRGLDKFTSVLSELEAKREKIMASTGAQGISMVRFMYSNSQDWIPIIVRIREDRNNNNNQIVAAGEKKHEEVPPPAPAATTPAPAPENKVGRRLSDKSPWWKWRSSYFMPAMMVLILVCLAVFGRVFAICCTSIWWYLVPSDEGDQKKKRRVSKKKEYVKRLSDKRTLSTATAAAAVGQGKKIQELGSPRGTNNAKKE